MIGPQTNSWRNCSQASISGKFHINDPKSEELSSVIKSLTLKPKTENLQGC